MYRMSRVFTTYFTLTPHTYFTETQAVESTPPATPIKNIDKDYNIQMAYFPTSSTTTVTNLVTKEFNHDIMISIIDTYQKTWENFRIEIKHHPKWKELHYDSEKHLNEQVWIKEVLDMITGLVLTDEIQPALRQILDQEFTLESIAKSITGPTGDALAVFGVRYTSPKLNNRLREVARKALQRILIELRWSAMLIQTQQLLSPSSNPSIAEIYKVCGLDTKATIAQLPIEAQISIIMRYHHEISAN